MEYTVGSGNSPQVSVNEIASITGAGNLQIDGSLTTGSTLALNSSGVLQVASQPNITTLAGVFTGAANTLVTNDGDGTVTSESELSYDNTSEILQIGSNTFNTASIVRQAHVDGGGGKLDLEAGDGGGTNQDGGDVRIYGGKGTGSGTGGAIEFYVSTAEVLVLFRTAANL